MFARRGARTPHSKQIPRARRQQRGQRGQSLVEFALVAPIVFFLIFGVIEFALIEASIAAYNFAAKDSARLGSLLGRTDATADGRMLDLIASRVNGVVLAQTVKVEIYRADYSGTMVTTTQVDPGTGQVVTVAYENVYTAPIASPPVASPGTWPVDNRRDNLLDADYLGVRITYRYTYLTAFISGGSTSLTLTANSVQRIEPQDYEGHIEPVPALAAASPSNWGSLLGLTWWEIRRTLVPYRAGGRR